MLVEAIFNLNISDDTDRAHLDQLAEALRLHLGNLVLDVPDLAQVEVVSACTIWRI